MARKQISYCDLGRYIEDVDPEFHSAIRNCCAGYLFGLKGKAGITFLLPEKKNPIHKEIVDGSYGDVEEKSAATDKLSALVIYDKLETIEDIKGKSDDLPNALRKKVEVDVAKSTANEIKLKSGATLKLDKNFKDASRRRVLSVFILSGGGVPVDAPDAEYKYAKSRSGPSNRRKKVETKEGGEDEDRAQRDAVNNYNNKCIRMKITEAVAAAWKNCQLNGTSGLLEIGEKNISIGQDTMVGGARQPTGERIMNSKRNPYLEAVMSLINYIIKKCSDESVKKLLYGKILPMISYENIDFYLLIEPFVEDGKYLISTDIIVSWYESQPSFNMQTVLTKIEEMYNNAEKAEPAAVYKERYKLWEAVDDMREKVLKNRSCVATVKQMYHDMLSKDSVGNVSKIYPGELRVFYSQRKIRKLLEDELRYYAARVFKALELNYDRNLYMDLLNTIERNSSSLATDRDLKILNERALRCAIDPRERLEEIASFVNSTYFMFAGMSEKVHKKILDEFEISRVPSGDGDSVWMPDARGAAKKYRMINGKEKMGGARGAVAKLKKAMQGGADLTDEEMDALRTILEKHKKVQKEEEEM